MRFGFLYEICAQIKLNAHVVWLLIFLYKKPNHMFYIRSQTTCAYNLICAQGKCVRQSRCSLAVGCTAHACTVTISMYKRPEPHIHAWNWNIDCAMVFRGVAIVLLGIAFILADNFDTTEGFLIGRRSRDVSKFCNCC